MLSLLNGRMMNVILILGCIFNVGFSGSCDVNTVSGYLFGLLCLNRLQNFYKLLMYVMNVDKRLSLYGQSN